jgi:hypothetical protein
MTAIHVVDGYTDVEAVAAIAAEDAYIKNTGDIILGNLDFNGNQAVDVLLELLASAPSEAEGRMYFDTSTKKVYIYRGA